MQLLESYQPMDLEVFAPLGTSLAQQLSPMEFYVVPWNIVDFLGRRLGQQSSARPDLMSKDSRRYSQPPR